MCDELLAELQSTRGFNGQVRRILMTNLGRNMNASSVASRLETTPRTLRRKLRDQGLTFRQILDELRAEVASRYLRDTDMSIEDIAHALGFSDAANFRHAFRRWTNNSPQQFRESQVRRSRIGNP
jgi:AraC-like DNA-binding protein